MILRSRLVQYTSLGTQDTSVYRGEINASCRHEYIKDFILGSSLARKDAACESSFGLGLEWQELCKGNFTEVADSHIIHNGFAHIVQIGAHVGFEGNDPLFRGLLRFFQYWPRDLRINFHWTFVEPSPPNFKRLEGNLKKNVIQGMCSVHAINAAVVPNTFNPKPDENISSMTFYSLSETIDPETGYDSKSGKTLPKFITQVSSLDIRPITFNSRVFSRVGLDVNDYIVKTNVTARTYSNLLRDVMQQGREDNFENSTARPLLVLIDTEGYDCNIIKGISPESEFLPNYFIYENANCRGGGAEIAGAQKYLEETLGYAVFDMEGQNAVAVKKLI